MSKENAIQVSQTVSVPTVQVPVEVLGTFKQYDPQLDIPEVDGTRIVKCLYQVNKETKKKLHENVYVRVPVDHITESVILDHFEDLSQYFISFLQGVEDKMIKAQHSSGGVERIYTDGLTLAKLIDQLEISELGARLNKVQIEAWFDKEIGEHLAILFAGKLGIDDQSTVDDLAKLEAILAAYKNKFAALASPKCVLDPDDCDRMSQVISSVERETGSKSSLGDRFLVKLEKIKNRDEELLISL